MSNSWSDVLDHYGLAYTGSARTYLKQRASEWGLDVEHLKARQPKPGVPHRRRPEEVFVYGNPREKTERLRRLMIEVGVPYECSSCAQGSAWNGKPLTLQVDHEDGDRRNNRLENLRFLCPNCHSQTETWGASQRRECKSSENLCLWSGEVEVRTDMPWMHSAQREEGHQVPTSGGGGTTHRPVWLDCWSRQGTGGQQIGA